MLPQPICLTNSEYYATSTVAYDRYYSPSSSSRDDILVFEEGKGKWKIDFKGEVLKRTFRSRAEAQGAIKGEVRAREIKRKAYLTLKK